MLDGQARLLPNKLHAPWMYPLLRPIPLHDPPRTCDKHLRGTGRHRRNPNRQRSSESSQCFQYTPEQIAVGHGLIRASLLLQILLFGLFISLEVVFHMRLVKAGIWDRKLRTITVLLYTSSALILIRNIKRCIEVWQGYTGYLQKHEAFFYG